MRVELCPRSGNIFIHSENAEDKAELYEFWVENEKYKEAFEMDAIWTEQESREAGFEGDKAHVTIVLTCEGR